MRLRCLIRKAIRRRKTGLSGYRYMIWDIFGVR